MAFDKTQPTDTTKLRNLGTVIRPNWEAIATAAATFKPDGINFDKNAVDRAAIADAVVMYNKGNYLYAIDPSSVITQLTGLSVTAANPGSMTLPGGIIVKWGSGAIASAAGGTQINFVSAFTTNCWQVIVTPLDVNANYASVVSKVVGSFKARGNSAITVSYIAIGN